MKIYFNSYFSEVKIASQDRNVTRNKKSRKINKAGEWTLSALYLQLGTVYCTRREKL